MAQIDPAEVEPVEVSKDGYAIGLDLVQLESTRFGLELIGVGTGLALVLGELAMFGSDPVAKIFSTLATLGVVLEIIGLLQTAPTPNGFLPKWLRWLLVGVLGFGVVYALTNSFAYELWSKLFAWTHSIPVGLVCLLVTLSLPWILWRFCQHRGLIGRAITWLWLALVSSALTVINYWDFSSEIRWVHGLWPAIGVLFAVTAHYTARDIWLDAVNRKTKKIVGARPEPEADPAT